MSSLSSSKRKLNAKSVWIAQEVQRKKLEIAKQFVEEKVRTDAEFAKDVLTAVGDNLPPELKKAAEETVARELNKVVNLPKRTTEELLKKWNACETVENIDPKTAVILESQPTPLIDKTQPLPEGAKPYIADGGCSAVDVPKEELLKALEVASERQTEILKEAGLLTEEHIQKSIAAYEASGLVNASPSEEKECCGHQCGCHMRPSDEEMMRPMADDVPLDDVPLGDGFIAVQSDGGGRIIVHETEHPNYLRDGE